MICKHAETIYRTDSKKRTHHLYPKRVLTCAGHFPLQHHSATTKNKIILFINLFFLLKSVDGFSRYKLKNGASTYFVYTYKSC